MTYSTSTQRRFWTFANEDELTELRSKANMSYVKRAVEEAGEAESSGFLTAEEEAVIVRHYEKIMRDFLLCFKPRRETIPECVQGTAFHYFKRFYLVSSVVDYHPKEIMITCIFLSSKTCEYHVPIDLFVNSIGGNRTLLKNVLLDQEFEVLSRLKFHLNVHLPHRSVEGLMIQLKTHKVLTDPDSLKEHIGKFVGDMWFTDVCLLYPPSLIALAAVMYAVTVCKENIDHFIINHVLSNPSQEVLKGIILTVREIRTKVSNIRALPSEDVIKSLEIKLSHCRNPRNNPISEEFKRRMIESILEKYGETNH